MSEVGWQDILQYSKILCSNSFHVGQSLTTYSHSAAQDIPGLLWNLKIHYSVHKSPLQISLICKNKLSHVSHQTLCYVKRSAVTSNIQVTPSLIIRKHFHCIRLWNKQSSYALYVPNWESVLMPDPNSLYLSLAPTASAVKPYPQATSTICVAETNHKLRDTITHLSLDFPT